MNYDRIPDNEYVELIRKRLAGSKARAGFHIALGCGVLGLYIVILIFLIGALADAEARHLPVGMAIGTIIGIILGQIVVFAGWSVYIGVLALRGNRTEKLLVRYYDHCDAASKESTSADGGE